MPGYRKLTRLKLLIIFNPNAAYGRSARKLPAIQRRLSAMGIKTVFMPTRYAGHGREIAASADLSNFDGLVAAGGDGTLFEVLNGLYEHPKAIRIPLGLIPIGTGNAFARDMDLMADDLEAAIGRLQRAETRQVDVALVRSADASFYFVNILVMGFAVDAGLVSRKLKFLGKRAYTLATLWQVLKLKSYPLTMEIDGRTIESNNIFVAMSNSRYTGTHFLMAPSAELDDGQLDVTLLESLRRTRLLKLFPTIYSGRHVEYREVSCCKASRISIRAPEGLLLGPDGEFLGHSPAEISCLHRDLTIFC